MQVNYDSSIWLMLMLACCLKCNTRRKAYIRCYHMFSWIEPIYVYKCFKINFRLPSTTAFVAIWQSIRLPNQKLCLNPFVHIFLILQFSLIGVVRILRRIPKKDQCDIHPRNMLYIVHYLFDIIIQALLYSDNPLPWTVILHPNQSKYGHLNKKKNSRIV